MSCYFDCSLSVLFFFFKQKTAYEMRISDWSSDVCSSDLVDQRAENNLSAKSRGIAEGQRMALRILLERITLRDDHDRLPEIDDKLAMRTVRDFSVAHEKIGGGHYIASLTVRFNPEEVRSEEHTSELQSLMRISYAVFCLKK